MCTRIHLHVLLRAADTHAYTHTYGNCDSYSNTNTYPDAESFSHTEISADTSASADDAGLGRQ